MEIDLRTVLFTVGLLSLLIERAFYYRSKYRIKNSKSKNTDNPWNGAYSPTSYDSRIKKLEGEMNNPGYSERIGKLETSVE
ncbi:unnamed protein product, partial [marine sediment metagenome]